MIKFRYIPSNTERDLSSERAGELSVIISKLFEFLHDTNLYPAVDGEQLVYAMTTGDGHEIVWVDEDEITVTNLHGRLAGKFIIQE